MNIKELLETEPQEIVNALWHQHALHDEIWGVDMDKVVADNRYAVHIFHYWSSDGGYRIWELSGVKFDGEWLGVMQHAGRSGDDYVRAYILDRDLFIRSWRYLEGLKQKDEEIFNDRRHEFVSLDRPADDLYSFYNEDVRYPFRY